MGRNTLVITGICLLTAATAALFTWILWQPMMVLIHA